MMEDLISMHMELRQFYGPEESGCPQWMTWEKLELLPRALKDIVLGSDRTELGGWMSIYRMDLDVNVLGHTNTEK